MAEKDPCCALGKMSCCRVESIVSIDERGQDGASRDPRERPKYDQEMCRLQKILRREAGDRTILFS
jgi:hypothetical protein